MAAGQEPPVWPPRAEDLVDILVYVTVLSLAVEYVPTVLSETYTVSLITAVLLKIVLEVVVRAEGWVKKRWAAASTSRGKALAGLAMLGVVLGTKVLVLELIALKNVGRG